MNRAYEFSKQKAAEKRRRVQHRERLLSGITKLPRNPLNLIFLGIVLAVCAVAYSKRENIPFPESVGNDPLLLKLYTGIFTLFLAIIAILLLLGVLYVMGTPKGSRSISDKLYQIRLTDRYGFPPILVSRQKTRHSDIERMTFYSLGISKEMWEQHKQAVEDVLNVHFKEPIQYDNRRKDERNYIVLVVAPGVERRREEPLYDDKL